MSLEEVGRKSSPERATQPHHSDEELERTFFGSEINQAAQDVVGRSLTPQEYAAVSQEVARRATENRFEIRKFFKRYGKKLFVVLSVLLGYETMAKSNEPALPPEPVAIMDAAHQEKIIAQATETEEQRGLGEDFLEFVDYNFNAYKGSPEYVGRTGKPEWTPYERLNYSKLPIEAKLYALHPEFANYSDTEFLTHFDDLMESARTEFIHTDLREQLATGAIERLVRLAPNLQPDEALQYYDNLYPVLENEMGIQYTVALRVGLEEILSPEQPVMLAIHSSHSEEDERLLDKSVHKTASGEKIERSIVFDQARGVVDVQAKVGEQTVLLSSYPGNGGDPRFASTGRKTKEYAATRAGTFRIQQLERGHVSLSWANSLIPQDAAIKQVGDDIMYQGKDGKFHYATGPHAEFAGRTPFDGDLTAADRQLLESAGERVKVEKNDADKIAAIQDNGGWLVKVGPTTHEYILPMPAFTLDDFKDEHGQLVAKWGKNDFGPRSILYTTLDGESSSQLFHSSYDERQGIEFLDHSHGCTHMYQTDLGEVFELVNPGDTISISGNPLTFEDTIVSKIPRSTSAPQPEG